MAWKSRVGPGAADAKPPKSYRWPTRKRGGEVAEAAFLAKAASLGFGVAKTWGDSDPFDFLLHSGPRVWRVQVKSAYEKQGRSFAVRPGNDRATYTKQDVDFLVVYIVPADAWYVVPAEAICGRASLWFFPQPGSKARFERYREAWCLMACKNDGSRKQEIILPCPCASGSSDECPLRKCEGSKVASP